MKRHPGNDVENNHVQGDECLVHKPCLSKMNNVSFNEVKLLVDLPLLPIPRSSGVVLASVIDGSFLNNSNLSTTEPILQLSQSHVEN